MAKKIKLTNRRTGQVIERDAGEHFILPDGFTLTVPLFMQDALQRTVAADAAARGLAHRSGYQFASSSLSDAAIHDARQEAQDAYDARTRWTSEQWRNPPPSHVNDWTLERVDVDPKTRQFTATGTMSAAEYASYKQAKETTKGAAKGEAASAGAADAAYWDHVRELQDAWKHP